MLQYYEKHDTIAGLPPLFYIIFTPKIDGTARKNFLARTKNFTGH